MVSAIACHGEGDKRRYVSASGDKTVRVWDVAAGAAARPAVDGHAEVVTALARVGDGRRVVNASLDKTLRVWGLKARGKAAVSHGVTRHGEQRWRSQQHFAAQSCYSNGWMPCAALAMQLSVRKNKSHELPELAL